MKAHFINQSNIVEVVVLEPYDKESDDYFCESHKWIVSITTNVQITDGFPLVIKKEYETEEECLRIINRLGLVML